MQSAARSLRNEPSAGVYFGESAVTFVLVACAWLALDDITTDNSTGFRPEYVLLTTCSVWALVLACDLIRRRHRWLGVVSVGALAAAAWVASDGLGHVRDGGWHAFWPEYTVVLAAWLWFLALAIALITFARKAMSPADASA